MFGEKRETLWYEEEKQILVVIMLAFCCLTVFRAKMDDALPRPPTLISSSFNFIVETFD